MKTVVFSVPPLDDSFSEFSHVREIGKSSQAARISRAVPELLWQVLSAKRRDLLKVLCGAGAVSIRESAPRVERDLKAAHGDVTGRGVASNRWRYRVSIPCGACDVSCALVRMDFGGSRTLEDAKDSATNTRVGQSEAQQARILHPFGPRIAELQVALASSGRTQVKAG
ncbi:MAG TPA: hypothetical protein PLJ77_09640 [Dokdonella sp.]|uniref:HVO_A0114 family putative DNA-binding protein n=1 Tax=Dokdonella sp. TaxID=2291710 RepID=UPI002C1B5845|nr:hypothetical protein [Dokdonella sp.]HQY54876.1 hypothetical protein [Dokdonella sp.]HQZ62188.1 hypothetical protein [Dokdonella sp.]